MTEGEMKQLLARLHESADDFVLLIRDRDKNQFLWATSDYNWALGAGDRFLDLAREAQRSEGGEQGVEA